MVVSSVHEAPRAEPPGGGPVGTSPEVHPVPRAVVAACLAVLCLPLLVALGGFRRPTWTPVLDLAMTELRVRDVGGPHTPLIGLPGRIGTLSQQGSHPGPISFYALAPTYRLLGSTAWALQIATVVVHAVAMGAALAIAGRRGGRDLVLGVAVLLAALTAGYGGGALTEPWNPYLPLLWWVVALLAVWSVLCGDVVLLPVAVLAASFCAQTHVPYLGLSLGMGALALAGVALRWWRSPVDRGRLARWVVAATALGVVLWLPPTLDQVRHEPGNYRQLLDHFADPDEEVKGFGDGVEVGLRYFDVVHLVQGDVTDPGWLVTSAGGHRPSTWRGVLSAAVWLGTALLAWRRRHRTLVALHAVVAVGLVLMVVAISRIFGVVWYYLILWGWGIGLLAALAAVWTLASVVAGRGRSASGPAGARWVPLALAAVGLVTVGRFALVAEDSRHADATVAAQLALVVDDTAEALDAADGAATGRDGRYLVTWNDAFHIGSQGFGLLSELERRGFDVGVEDGRRVPATAHRVLDPAVATARVHLATGAHVDRWRAVPGAVEVATADPRSRSGRAEQEHLRDEVIATLQRLGLDELVPGVDDNLFGVAIDERVPTATREQMGRMLEIGAPLSIFIVPPDTPDP